MGVAVQLSSGYHRVMNRTCVHCGNAMPEHLVSDAKYCSDQCRAAAGIHRTHTAAEISRTLDFVKKAQAVHGTRYGYDLVEYKRNNEPVEIRCSVHGVFQQRPMSHLAGSGCAACAGRKRLDHTTFLSRALEVHGGRFDYSQVETVNNTTKVTIICRIHGPFEQTPKSHLRGAACGYCSGTMKLDTVSFVARARAVHGDEYGYDLVDYRDIFTKVIIVCPVHGEFQQSPVGHLQGYRCRACARKKPYTNETFATAAKDVHGDKYGYELVEYVSNKVKVTVVCPEHGPWPVTPNSHLRGSGCRRCAGGVPYTGPTFIARAREVHGERYGYDDVDFHDARTKVQITCPIHGNFSQTPAAHISGNNCPECSPSKRLTTETFILRARDVHGDKYGYDSVDYVRSSEKVTITCWQHGNFEQSAASHLSGVGCPACGGVKPLTTESFIMLAQEVHGGKYNYDLVHYTGNKKPVTIICPIHGAFEKVPNHHLGGGGCTLCSESVAEGVIRSLLTSAGIEFATEWTHPTLVHSKSLRFDFMLTEQRTLIEFDGAHHRVPIFWPTQTKAESYAALDRQKARDAIKDLWAEENGWRLIRLRNLRTIRIELADAGVLSLDAFPGRGADSGISHVR